MLDTLDQTIIPDPLNPQPGDVYARDISGDPDFKPINPATSHRDIPYRIVVRTVRGALGPFEAYRIVAYRDGNETAFSDADEMAAMLASIPGIRPLGRMRGAPPSGDRRELDIIRGLIDNALKPLGHTPDPLQSVASLAAIVVNRLEDFEARAAEQAPPAEG